MRIPTYLTQSRHSIFYFRWPLPAALHPQGKQRTLRFSLGTRNPRLALHLARHMAYHAENITGRMLGMDYIDIKNELQGFFSKWLENRKREIHRNGLLPLDRIQSFESDLQDLELAIDRNQDDFTHDESLAIRGMWTLR